MSFLRDQKISDEMCADIVILKHYGMSSKDIAERMECDPAYVNRIVRGVDRAIATCEVRERFKSAKAVSE